MNCVKMNKCYCLKNVFFNHSKILFRMPMHQKLPSRHCTLRRALLYVPGSDQRKLEKAFQLKIDCIVMDCEDGVALNQKEVARQNIKNLLDKGPVTKSDPEWSVRVNPVHATELFEADITTILSAKNLPVSVCLPKVNSVDDLQLFAEKVWNELIKRPEDDRGPLKLIILIESAISLVILPELCKKAKDLSTMAPVVPVGLIFGGDDFCADIGGVRTQSELELLYPRQKIVLVAKAFGLQAIDVVFKNYQNHTAFKENCKTGAILGYTGKQVIHPDQVAIAQDMFVPSRLQIRRAKGILRAFKENQEKGKGAFTFENEMIDMPSVRQALYIMKAAKAGGKLDDDWQQAASLARRMAGKKGQTSQLQIEVNNEEDWEKLLEREGLIVIDVYSEWSGPCVGMLGNLKKAKVDFGGDSLHLAIAKNDEIEVLARFRNRSEPTWLFAAGGMMVNLAFGANAPKLMKMIDYEVKHELRVLKGETWRHGVSACVTFLKNIAAMVKMKAQYINKCTREKRTTGLFQGPFTELHAEEKERLEISERLKIEAEKEEEEKKNKEIEEKRMKVYNYMAEHLCYETVIICFPHTIYPDAGCIILPELDHFVHAHMMYINYQSKILINKTMFDEIFYRGALEPTEDLLQDLASGPCLVLLLKCQIIVTPGQEGEKSPGDLEKLICESLNSTQIEPGQELVVPAPNSIPAKYPLIKKIKQGATGTEGKEGEEEEENIIEEETSVPGCWTPASYITKCAAIRYLFPARAEKVMQPEEEEVKSKIVMAFDIAKEKECYDIIEEYREDILNVGYFSGTDPTTAEHLCATPEQYSKLQHVDTNKLVIVMKKVKSEPLLSFAGLGAAHVSLDEKAGAIEADLFFPPGVEPKFPKLEEAERITTEVEENQEEELEEEEETEEQENHDEDDLMALLGVSAV